MNLILIFGLIASLTLLLALRAVRRNRLEQAGSSSLLRPVDLQAFCNLVDPREEAFLRQSLSNSDFKSLQRERMRAAADYVRDTVYNTGVLLQLGQAAALNSNPAIAVPGRQLVEKAFRLRTYAVLALGKVYLRVLFPGTQFSGERLAERYQQLRGLAGAVARMERSALKADLPAAV